MATKKRLIDANALADTFAFLRKMWSGTEIMAVIDNAPTVDAVEVVHGRWKGAGMGDYCCSLCSEVVSGNEHNFCPNCGAKMDGERRPNAQA